MADQQVGPGLYVKLGMDMASLVSSGGAAAIVLNQSLQLFQQFERYGQQAFDNTVGKAIAYQEAIEDLHNTLGIANSDAQKWKSTLVSFDTDMGAFSSSLRYLTQRVSDTSASGESLRATLKGIGVDAKDASGNYKNASDLMQEILVAFDKIPDGARKANLEVEIFGRNWYNIANLVNNGTLAVQKFKEQQPLFSEETLENIDKTKIKLAEVFEKLDAIGAKVGAGILGDPLITQVLDALVLSGNVQYEAYMSDMNRPVMQTFEEWMARSKPKISGGADWTNKTISQSQNDLINALPTGPETLQKKLDEIINTTLPKLKQAYLDAIPNGNTEQINSARKAYGDALDQQFEITNQIRDQNLQYQQIVDITLPRLKEALNKAKASGLKSDIEAAEIALKQGVNSANDLGTALGKAAISASDIKASITIAAGWSSSTIVGSVGSERAAFMIDEMQHGVPPDVAAQAWANGAHSYIKVGGTFGTLGEAIASGKTPTENLGRNERERLAALGTGSADASEINDSETDQNNLLKSDVRTQASFNRGLDRSQSKMEDLVQEGKDLNAELTTAKEAADGLGDFGRLDEGLNYSQLYDETITAKMREQWEQQEADGLTHYGSLAEMSRVRSQAELDYMIECVNFAGSNPIRQYKIIESAEGPDWTPPAFYQIQSVKLTPADFSGIKTLIGGSSAGSGSESGTSQQTQAAGSTAKTVNVTNVTINNPQGLTTPASIKQASKALANALKRGSAT